MPSTAAQPSRSERVARIAAASVVALIGGFCAALLAIRFVAFPQVEAHRADIGRWLGTRIGQPVEIDGLDTGWDGWNPRLTIRGFRVRERAGSATVLDLPRVDLSIAWTSLPLLDLRLKELTLDAPRLAVRRDSSGRLHVAGIEVEADANVDDSAFADWLMRQPQIVVRDALVSWNDELRRAPQLLLDHVQFRLEQRFNHHRAGLTGVPPAELAAPIDLRVDLAGQSLKDLRTLRGKLYLRLDYADVAAWREWIPIPFAIESGKGALRVWVDVDAAQAVDVVADLELVDVRATLDEKLAPLALAHLSGRAGWKRAGERTEFSATRLSFALPDGVPVAPTDFRLALADRKDSSPGGGAMTFKQVDLLPFAAIAAHLPLPEALRRDIAQYDLQGTLRDGSIEWTGAAEAPERYSVKAQFQNLGVAARNALPGAANLSGSVDANERGGQLRIASEGATIALPKLFAEPLAFDSVKGDVAWKSDGANTRLALKDVAFANADISGTTAGTWRSRDDGPGDIDLKAQLTRANLAGAYHYLPAAAGPAVRDWLRRALVGGSSSDARLTLAGDLGHFPFAQGKGGQFQIVAKAQDATLDYAEGWPPITAIAGDVRIEGSRLTVNATSGRVLNAQIGATRAEIPELRDAHPLLRIDGTASGATSEFLAFVAKSPVAGWIDHVVDNATASGDGRLALKFDLPLRDGARTTVAGAYEFVDNTVRLPGTPQLGAVNGKLTFTEDGMRATDLTAEALGGRVTLSVASEQGHVRVSGNGTANLQLVRKEYDTPLLDQVTGSTDWQLSVDVHGEQVAWSVESTLLGATVDLPAPIGKRAGDAVALRVERRELTPREDRIAIDYGRVAKAVLHRQSGTQGPSIDRALVLVGKSSAESAEADRPGIWIRADVASLDLDAWLAVDLSASTASSKSANVDTLAMNGVDLQVGSLQALGRIFTKLKATARRDDVDWRIVLDGSELAGSATWRGASSTQQDGRLVARLTRFATPSAVENASSGATATTPPANAVRRWPAVDLVAETLVKKGHALGRLEMLAQPSGTDWQIQKLALANDAGRIDAQGWWHNTPPAAPQTRLDVAIDVKEAGAFLGRFGWPDAIKGAPTKIDGQVSWAGAPSDFDYPSLAGSFKLQAGAGQFTKLEPGVGRLLGVLSLQALPRRISLDFRDVFSEGFAFDTVSGDVRMQSGIMHTDDFRLVGPAAAVNIAGDVDLARETQQLKVRVQPSLSSGVSAGAAALFIANPLLGAAVGAGTLLAQKMLNNPLDQLFSYEYAVSGGWDDPQVARTGARAATAAQSSATIR